MIIIAHRANGFGFPENSIDAICACLEAGFVPEVDLWYGKFISHDKPRGGEPTLQDLCARTVVRPRLVHLKDKAQFRAVALTGSGETVHTLHEADTREQLPTAQTRGVVVTDDDEWLTSDDMEKLDPATLVLAAGRNIFRRNEKRWRELYDIGVDGIITDDPRALKAFLEDL